MRSGAKTERPSPAIVVCWRSSTARRTTSTQSTHKGSKTGSPNSISRRPPEPRATIEFADGSSHVDLAYHDQQTPTAPSNTAAGLNFVTYAWSLLALKQAGVPLNGTIELHFTYDEEAGGNIGPGLLVREGISKPDLVISAGFSYGVVNAHNGCLHLEVQVDGKSAHAAAPYTGIDALEAAAHVLSTLYAWRKTLARRVSAVTGIGSAQLTVGLIKGGINTNVVPDRVTFRLDRRMIPEERSAEVEAELVAVITGAAKAYPEARVTVRRILVVEPLTPIPAGQRLTDLLCQNATRIMGEKVGTKGVPLYTDAPHYVAAGIPVVLYGAGPHSIEEANAHRADERLPLSDLYKATEVVALTLAELLGGPCHANDSAHPFDG